MTSDDNNPAFAREVGERLRDIRRQQGLSLQAVEETSGREFKASVLGAYERGERIISVLRLQRLAALYGAPVDQLLPRGVTSTGHSSTESDEGSSDRPKVEGDAVTFDLAKLQASQAPERELLRRYLGMIQVQRGDFNGRVITIRNEDVRALARVFELDEASMRRRFDELGIRV
jgi:transcriptional regulator with XRE-family HTH domain